MSRPSISQHIHPSRFPMIALSQFDVHPSTDVVVSAPATLLVDSTTRLVDAPRYAMTGVKSKVETKPKIPLRYVRKDRRRAIPFPLKLMQILEDDEFSDIISWMPNGKTFIILRPKAFVNKVLPHTFKSVQYTSFTRKLIRWGFSRCENGTGEFYHPKFRRGRFDLVEKMITSNSTTSNDDATEENDDKEDDTTLAAAPRSSDTKETGETRSLAQCQSTTVFPIASPQPVVCLGSVPRVGASLSNQRLLAATHRTADLLQMEMETFRLRQRLHAATCSSLSADLLPTAANLLPIDNYSMLSSPSMDMCGLLPISPSLNELRAARASSAIRMGLLHNPALVGSSRDRVRLAYPTGLDEILSHNAVPLRRHLDPSLIR